MSSNFVLNITRDSGVPVLAVSGYIGEIAGERLLEEANLLIDEGQRFLVVDLDGTDVISSNGISILIEVLARLIDLDGKLAFCNVAPVVERAFAIMGLTQYAQIYRDRSSAVLGLSAAADDMELNEIAALEDLLSSLEKKLVVAQAAVDRMLSRVETGG